MAGGVPRAKVDSIKLRHITENPAVSNAPTKRAKAKEIVRNIPKARKGWQGGMGGFRESAHYIVESTAGKKLAERGPVHEMTHGQAFSHGVSEGKIEPERVIMRQMKNVRRVGHGVLGAGLGMTAGGVALATHKHHEVKKADSSNRKRAQTASATTLGVGGTAAAASYGAKRVFRGQERKWEGQARKLVAESGRMAPGLGTEMERSDPKSRWKGQLIPKKLEQKAINEGALASKTKQAAMEVGHMRGAARQAAYFGRTHHVHAKIAGKATKGSLAVAGLGAAGLVADKAHRSWKKNYG